MRTAHSLPAHLQRQLRTMRGGDALPPVPAIVVAAADHASNGGACLAVALAAEARYALLSAPALAAVVDARTAHGTAARYIALPVGRLQALSFTFVR